MKIRSEFIEALNNNYVMLGDFGFCYESNTITKSEPMSKSIDKIDNLIERAQYMPEYVLKENDILLRMDLLMSQLELCILLKNYLNN